MKDYTNKIIKLHPKTGIETLDYSTGYLYRNGEMLYFAHEEGRCLRTATQQTGGVKPVLEPVFRYEYNLKDHLGNVRISFTEDGTGLAMVLQEQHYEAYGMELGGLSYYNGETNRYTYSGKEKISEYNLGWSDFGARMYNPTIGRWNGVDALAEKYATMSGYMYVAGNPVLLSDIDGREFVVGGNRKQAKTDVKSILPEHLRVFVSINKKGKVSFNYKGAKKALGDKADAGTELLNTMVTSKKKYLYEAATETKVRNRESGKEQNENTLNFWGIINASETQRDKGNQKDGQLNHRPKEGYDGQVMIDPDAVFYEPGHGPDSENPQVKDRGDMVYHELEENKLRTEGNGDGVPLYYNPTGNLPGAHELAKQKASNYHIQGTSHGAIGGYTTSAATTKKLIQAFQKR